MTVMLMYKYKKIIIKYKKLPTNPTLVRFFKNSTKLRIANKRFIPAKIEILDSLGSSELPEKVIWPCCKNVAKRIATITMIKSGASDSKALPLTALVTFHTCP